MLKLQKEILNRVIAMSSEKGKNYELCARGFNHSNIENRKVHLLDPDKVFLRSGWITALVELLETEVTKTWVSQLLLDMYRGCFSDHRCL